MRALLLAGYLLAAGCADRDMSSPTPGPEGCISVPTLERTSQMSERVLGVVASGSQFHGAYATTSVAGTTGQATLVTFDNTATLQGEASLGSRSGPAEGMSPHPSGGFVIAASHVALFSAEGTMVWEYRPPLSHPFGVTTAHDGGAWAVYAVREGAELGGSPLPDVRGLVLIRIDSAGAYVNHHLLLGASLRGEFNLTSTSDGGVVMTGEFTGQLDFGGIIHETADRSDFVVRVAADGSTEWVAVFPDSSTSTSRGHSNAVVTLSDDSVVYAQLVDRSRVHINRIDPSGEVVWTESTGFDSIGRAAMARAPDNRLVLVGSGSTGDRVGLVEVYSPEGELLVSQGVCSPEPRMLPGGVAATDTHIALAGEVRRDLEEPVRVSGMTRDNHQDAFFQVFAWDTLGL